jgi:carbon storage regulator
LSSKEFAMLVLTRELKEAVVIGGLDGITPMIKVTIVRAGERVRLGIEAPADIPVHREEVWEEIKSAAKPQCRSGAGRKPI